ncbi:MULTISPECIES: MurR/RpiR family transcriptional regulator [Pseudomonas]|jgi:DNA-binding MurR/RpiR family transcriptional regulator|uniref:Transcriptional regulator, RpiR family n=1 Tax=Pseudomonas oryzihabitans TaxID=47885 RepID=A0A1G5M8B6_9PSED|nr:MULTISPECIES: MurR/RpiR family transcriptional regulator [Pseudomonas]NMY88608.1 MurR/RpiR family transcriptional regulator [Pseudomonas psychrotolerans]SCZ21432.1 transcriptional regulator, RpiR family [Pseudomonas psychrotolerans]
MLPSDKTRLPTPTSLESRIKARYEQMSVVEQKLSDVILAAPGQLAMQTATELATRAGVSKATATRFFRTLGYASYDEARRQARVLRGEGSPLYLQDRGATERTVDDLLQHHLEQELANVRQTYQSLNRDELFAAVHAIVGARRVVIIGFRHSQTIAHMVRSHLIQVRDDILLLPSPGDSLAEYLAGLGPDDVAICIGLRRRMPQLEKTMVVMGQLGVRMLYLADVLAGSPAQLATWVIRCHTESTLMFDSNSSVSAMTNLLCSLVGKELTARKTSHLETAERLHQQLEELDNSR